MADPTLASYYNQDNFTINIGGVGYLIKGGSAYDMASGSPVLIEHLYDPDYWSKNFLVENGIIYRVDGKGGKFPVITGGFTEPFEAVSHISGLITPDRRWTEITLQSPRAKTTVEYVPLGQGIISSRMGFLDNVVWPIPGPNGGALLCSSVGKTSDMVCAKSSLSTQLLHRIKGQSVKVAFTLTCLGPAPYSVLDLESTFIVEYPGWRITLENGYPGLEFKWGTKPKFTQNNFRIGTGQTARLELTLFYSDVPSEGSYKLSANGVTILLGNAQTLPLPNALVNSLEIGITATSGPASVLVDNLVVS